MLEQTLPFPRLMSLYGCVEPVSKRERNELLALLTTKGVTKQQSTNSMHCQTKRYRQSLGKRKNSEERRKEGVFGSFHLLVTQPFYRAQLFPCASPLARRFLSGLLSVCRALWPRRSPRTEAHNAATVKCSVSRERPEPIKLHTYKLAHRHSGHSRECDTKAEELSFVWKTEACKRALKERLHLMLRFFSRE